MPSVSLFCFQWAFAVFAALAISCLCLLAGDIRKKENRDLHVAFWRIVAGRKLVELSFLWECVESIVLVAVFDRWCRGKYVGLSLLEILSSCQVPLFEITSSKGASMSLFEASDISVGRLASVYIMG